MKKILALILAFSVLSVSVFASDISVVLDGTEVAFSAQEPVIVGGRTLIPLRGVFEQLGYEISWDGATKTATFDNGENIIEITAGSDTFVMNGEAVSLDVPASIINGSMLLPLRAVGEAAGLEVSWDGDTRTVSLLSPDAVETTEASTEEVTEETTVETTTAAAVVEDDIPAADLERLKNSANSEATVYSTSILLIYFFESAEYVSYKLAGGLAYSYSEEELKGILTDAIEECKTYKTAAGNISTVDADKSVVKKFDTIMDCHIDYYQFIYNAMFTDMYENMTNLGFNQKSEELGERISDAYDDYTKEMYSLADKVDSVIADSTYNGAIDRESLTTAEKNEIDAYYEEIAETVNAELKVIYDADDADENSSMYITAAANIKNKVNSVKTPKHCMLDKQCLLRACELLNQSGKAIKNGAYTKDGKNEAYLEYRYCIVSMDLILFSVLGDLYNLKSDEYNEVADEIEGITI